MGRAVLEIGQPLEVFRQQHLDGILPEGVYCVVGGGRRGIILEAKTPEPLNDFWPVSKENNLEGACTTGSQLLSLRQQQAVAQRKGDGKTVTKIQGEIDKCIETLRGFSPNNG